MSENQNPPKRLKQAQTTLLGYVVKEQNRVKDLEEGEVRIDELVMIMLMRTVNQWH
jgi:hypothetical protein